MRTASFPAMSPWFRRSLSTEYPSDVLASLEPRGAYLSGITDKHNAFHTARVTYQGREVSATARTAPAALRAALAKLDEPLVEIVSVLS